MLQKSIELIFGSKRDHDMRDLLPLLRSINLREAWAMGLDDAQFKQQTARLREQAGANLETLLPEAYVLAREAARRVLGERLYDSQVMGAISLHRGNIVEMKTGEGKTISSVPATYLNTLTGQGVHIVTVNDYLAKRDAEWMRPVYEMLGLSVGYIISDMDTETRKRNYACDITYATNNELGFDYLRDNMCYDLKQKTQRGQNFCIIDEIDSILIDEARTPLIISGATEEDTGKYVQANRLIRSLTECAKDEATGDYPENPVGDYKIDEKNKRVSFTDEGMNHIEGLLQSNKLIDSSLFAPENFSFIHHFTQALVANRLYKTDREYVVREGQVQIVDEFTGRILVGRRYSSGLHQAIEAKEGIRIAGRNRTLATITFQNFFRLYNKVAGMTGTAETEAKEFGKIYGMEVVVIPTNRIVVREDNRDLVFLDEKYKYDAICDEIEDANKRGQPVLVGTISIDHSERLSGMLAKRGIHHEVLNAKNHSREALIIAEAGAKHSITIATNMAGRGTDIKLGGNPEFRARGRVAPDALPDEYERTYSEEIKRWRTQYQEVRDLGGLYVIGTERHESRRIDNQLRGRSGRQGDTGRSRFFISMDDELIRLFGRGGERMKSIMSHSIQPDEPLDHVLIDKSIERAQTRVEERNFDIRKHLLEYDDVVNAQRKLIYVQRDQILADTRLKERVLGIAREIVTTTLANYVVNADKAQLPTALETIKTMLFFKSQHSIEELGAVPAERLVDELYIEMERDLSHKEQLITPERFNSLIRFEYIRNIDQRWQDHLENLESLREAVYLRSYGQRNPLLEYKVEGFQIFDRLVEDIRAAVSRTLFAIRIEQRPQATVSDRPLAHPPLAHPPLALSNSHLTTTHGRVSMFGEQRPIDTSATVRDVKKPEQSSSLLAKTSASRTSATQTLPKVGRNDPCPCGSGKKYKFCHGS